MERNGRRAAAPAVRLRTLVPLTSREEEDRYWYDDGDRGASRLAWGGARLVYRFDRFGCDNDGPDTAWTSVGLRPGH
jgi:hypothetical protein